MKTTPLLILGSIFFLGVGAPSLLRAQDDSPNRRDFKSSTGGLTLIVGSGGNATAPTTGAAPAAGSPSTPAAGSAQGGATAGSSAGSASTSWLPTLSSIPAAPTTPPPPPPQRPGDRRENIDPTGGVNIWLPGLLNGPAVPSGTPQLGNRRDF